MATIAFPFKSQLALRIANLITGDIERLEKEVLGTTTNWQAFERPMKAHYANAIVERVENHNGHMAKVMELLPTYEANVVAYQNNPNKRGRPLTQFENVEIAPDVPVPARNNASNSQQQVMENNASSFMQDANAMTDDQLIDALVKEIESDNATNATASDTAANEPTRTHGPQSPIYPDTSRQVTQGDANPNPDAQAALAALMAALTPKPQEIKIDETAVRTLAREVAKEVMREAIRPTHVMITTPDNQTIDVGLQHKSFPTLITTMATKFPVWMPGPAGSGKTTAAKNAAKAFNVAFHHTGAVDNVYQLLGFIDAGGTYHRTAFREAYENGGVFLWDEVDASNPAALVAFNAALENGECVFPDATIPKHADCYFVAAANTFGTGATHEYVGRTKIDAATVDRYIMLEWEYDETLERAIAGDNDWTQFVQRVRRVVKDTGTKHIVSPRASIRGNALIAAGVPRDQVINMTVRKGLPDDTWRMIKNRL